MVVAPVPNLLNEALRILCSGELLCPFCGERGGNITASEEGPSIDDGAACYSDSEAGSTLLGHLVYCIAEDRNFVIMYRAKDEIPSCPACDSAFDVMCAAPRGLHAPRDTFSATAECAICCDGSLGEVRYEAFDIRHLEFLNNG